MKKTLCLTGCLLLLIMICMPASAEKECWFESKYGYHDTEVVRTVNPTCTADGYKELECRQCGKSMRRAYGSSLGHDMTDDGVLQASTCIEAGKMSVHCRRCGAKGSRALPLAKHDYGEWEVTVPATDHSAGKRSCVCLVCGDTQTESYYPEGTLYRGIGEEEKESVQAMQQMLMDLGFWNGGNPGVFDKKTETVVTSYQTHAGLKPDGIAWPQTLDCLQQEWKAANGDASDVQIAATEMPEAEPTAAPSLEPTATPAPLTACQFIMDENGAEHIQYCDHHRSIAEMISAQKTAENESLSQARSLWQTELDGLYDEWTQSAGDEEQGTVLAAKLTFVSYLTMQEAALKKQYDDEAAVTRQIIMILERQCVTLCNMLHE